MWRRRDAGRGRRPGRPGSGRPDSRARGGAGHAAVHAEGPGGPPVPDAGGHPAIARQGRLTVAAAGPATPSLEPPSPLAGAQLRTRMAAFLSLLRDDGFLVGLEEASDCLRFAAMADLARPSVLRTDRKRTRLNSSH